MYVFRVVKRHIGDSRDVNNECWSSTEVVCISDKACLAVVEQVRRHVRSIDAALTKPLQGWSDTSYLPPSAQNLGEWFWLQVSDGGCFGQSPGHLLMKGHILLPSGTRILDASTLPAPEYHSPPALCYPLIYSSTSPPATGPLTAITLTQSFIDQQNAVLHDDSLHLRPHRSGPCQTSSIENGGGIISQGHASFDCGQGYRRSEQGRRHRHPSIL